MTGLAIVLLVIFALIGIILFVPITYSFEVISRSPYRVELQVKWLYKVLRVHFAYYEGKPLFKEVIVLGKVKMGAARDYEEWLTKRVEEETGFMEQEQAYEAEEEVLVAEALQEEAAPVTEEPQVVRFDQEGKPIDYEPREDASEETMSEESTDAPAEEENPYKRWWLPHVKNGDLYREVALVSRRCFDHAKPDYFHMEGNFGVKNPYVMGLVEGAMQSRWGHHMEEVHLQYMTNTCEGSVDIRGRIALGVLAWHGTRFMLSKPVRSLIIDGVKWYRYTAKQKKKLNARAV